MFKGSSKTKKNKVNANEVIPVFIAQIGHSSSDCEQQQQHEQKQQQLDPVCTRQKKLNVSFEVGEVDVTDNYNIVINYKLLKELFTKVPCPNCNAKTANIRDKLDDRMGLVHKLQFSCSNPEL